LKNFKQYLTEKLILYNHGATYGQVVFLAGGAASGKGFSRESFMENHKFKIRDVDDWKASFLKLQKLKGKYPEIEGLDLKKPGDVFKLHEFVKKLGIKENTFHLLLGNARNPETLPNIMFDVTLKDVGDITEVTPELLAVGYKKENIHITWILADYHVAVKANRERSRVVPDDILLKTHEGAAETMHKILNGDVPKDVDGDIRVVLNNREHTITYGESANAAEKHKGNQHLNVGGFTYMTVKRAGKPIATPKEMQEKLHSWLSENVPKTHKLHAMLNAPREDEEHKQKAEKAKLHRVEPTNDNQWRPVSHQMQQGDGNSGVRVPSMQQRQAPEQDTGMVTIHRRHGGRIGFAFKTAGRKIGFTPQEAEKKIEALKKAFPGDTFVTIPYRQNNSSRAR
jgi:hypothetical protein